MHFFVVKHILYISVKVSRAYLCSNSTNLEGYLKLAWPQVYTYVKYEYGFCGILFEWIYIYCLFQWIFVDIFVISISICLSTRVRQLNEHLIKHSGLVSFV